MLALLAMQGCADAALPIYLADSFDTQENRDLIRTSISDYLGLDVRFTSQHYGALMLDLPAIAPGQTGILVGHAIRHDPCIKYAWAAPRPATIAHETAHTLGLRHVCEIDDGDCTAEDEENLMHPHVPPDTHLYLYIEQLETVWQAAYLLDACWTS
jgi:hypothetical protein